MPGWWAAPADYPWSSGRAHVEGAGQDPCVNLCVPTGAVTRGKVYRIDFTRQRDRVTVSIPAQVSHYGYFRMSSDTLKKLVEMISQRSLKQAPIYLPRMGQLHLWGSEARIRATHEYPLLGIGR